MALLQPGQPVRTWLRWAAFFYGLFVRSRGWWYRRGWASPSRLPCRVVSVGNLTVGGTGKTPVVILLAEWVQAEGLKVAVLSRGYKRVKGASRLLVSDGVRVLTGPSEAGDEPFLIAKRCRSAIVAVGADRTELGRWVLAQHQVDCMILDDGFQHRGLHRDVDVVLLDATDAAGLDALVPAGRLREPLEELARATAVVVTRADSRENVEAIHRRLKEAGVTCHDGIEVSFRPEVLVSVRDDGNRPLEWAQGKKTWLVSGIGNSQSFRRSAEAAGVVIVGETAFGDHHRYGGDDVGLVRAAARAAGAELVLTTEKDAGKLSSFLEPEDSWWALRIRVEILQGLERLRHLVLGEIRRGQETGA
ncbi:MAG: tetraacyldisaccharide 4'-kinase [Nitrospira sp.]|nr:tetraacyldisaccharide 4'-kinase [Nitrospira sp.]MCP9442089.1 tetraacyldisaccharide 4'-kinase [Nitrospira sp.]